MENAASRLKSLPGPQQLLLWRGGGGIPGDTPPPTLTGATHPSLRKKMQDKGAPYIYHSC